MERKEDDSDGLDSIVEKLDEGVEGEAVFSGEEFRKLEQTLTGAMIHGELERDPTEIAKFTLARLASEILDEYEEILEELEEVMDGVLEDIQEEIKSEQEFQESLTNVKSRLKKEKILNTMYDDIVLFFTLSYSIIEKFSAELLQKELIAEEFRDSKSTQKMLNRRFSQELRETLLLKCGILDNGLVSEMGHFRKTRNRLTHNLSEQQFLDPIEELESEVDRCINVLDELSRELDNGQFLVRTDKEILEDSS